MHSQQENPYSQYMFLQQMFNPGYTGTTEFTEVSLFHRSRWSQVEGAPRSYGLNLNIPGQRRVGVGASIEKDAIGIYEETALTFNSSYEFKPTASTNLSLGLSAGLNWLRSDVNLLNVYHSAELLDKMSFNEMSPSIGFGAFFHTDKFYVGYSGSQVFLSPTVTRQEVVFPQQKIHHNLTGGYVFESEKIKIKPAALLKYADGAPLNVNISANVMFREKYVTGLSYHLKAGGSVILGLHLDEGLFVGYNVELPYANNQRINFLSHEIMVRLNIESLIGYKRKKTDLPLSTEPSSNRFF